MTAARGPARQLLPALFVLLGGCGTGPATQVETEPLSSWPGFDYAEAASRQAVFELEPDRSQVDIVVRREGPLARFGHDHVVVVRDLEGWLTLHASGGRADLRFPPGRFEVDTPEARARHDLDTEPDREAIEGTERNLQTRVLDSDNWPWIELALRELRPDRGAWLARAEVSLRGETSTLDWPFHLQRTEDRVVVEGRVDLRQTELGLAPFSVLGGGLRVANVIEIHYRLQGSRLRDP